MKKGEFKNEFNNVSNTIISEARNTARDVFEI